MFGLWDKNWKKQDLQIKNVDFKVRKTLFKLKHTKTFT